MNQADMNQYETATENQPEGQAQVNPESTGKETNPEPQTEPKAEAKENGTGTNTTPEAKPEAQPKAEDRKPEMTKEERALQAEMRRLREENERLRRQSEQYSKARQESVTEQAMKDLGLTKEDLNDPDNLRLAEDYMTGAAKGEQNPALYALRQSRMRALEAKKEAKAQSDRKAETDKAIAEDVDRFAKKFPGVDMRSVMNPDSEFMRLYSRENLTGSVTEHYETFLAIKNRYGGAKANDSKEKAKAASNPPMGGQHGNDNPDKIPDIDAGASWEDIHRWQEAHGIKPHN